MELSRGSVPINIEGCDLLTVSPALLSELQASHDDVPLVLDRGHPVNDIPKTILDEKAFRWQLNEDEVLSRLIFF